MTQRTAALPPLQVPLVRGGGLALTPETCERPVECRVLSSRGAMFACDNAARTWGLVGSLTARAAGAGRVAVMAVLSCRDGIYDTIVDTIRPRGEAWCRRTADLRHSRHQGPETVLVEYRYCNFQIVMPPQRGPPVSLTQCRPRRRVEGRRGSAERLPNCLAFQKPRSDCVATPERKP